MFWSGDLPSPSSIFSAYASMTASVMLFRSVANDIIPHPLRAYLLNAIRYLIKPSSPLLTLVMEESTGIARNQVYDAAEIYLSARLTPDNERLKVSKSPKEKTLMIRLEKGERLVDCYDGVDLKWRFICSESEKNGNHPNDLNTITVRSEKRYFELCFHKKYKEMVLGSYLPFMLEKAKLMKDQGRVLKMHTLNSEYCFPSVHWDSINLEHPSTFDTLAMEPELKNAVMEDLNRFLRRKEFYKRVGRAWKRGYLLYGPPGTGKSSLIAAMANYLKFDIYDLQLVNILRDSDFRRLLLATANRSILVIEDIDCTVDLTERRNAEGRKQTDVQRTLSGLLNFIDGLWSSCGDERIIIFTTNHKERLDPALLRPGRMDMHIHMSYCTYHAFKHLASNYLGLSSDDEHQDVFREIEGLIEDTHITPAQAAEEIMRSEDPRESLQGFVNLLKRKKMEGHVSENEGHKPVIRQTKKRRVVNNSQQRKTKRICANGSQRRTTKGSSL